MAVANPCLEIPLYKFNNEQIKIFEENGFVFQNNGIYGCFGKSIIIKNIPCFIFFHPNDNACVFSYNETLYSKSNETLYSKSFRINVNDSVKTEDILENLDLICTEMTIHTYEYRIASFRYNSRKLTVLISVNTPAYKDGIIMIIDNGFHVYRDGKLSADEIVYLHTEKMNENQK